MPNFSFRREKNIFKVIFVLKPFVGESVLLVRSPVLLNSTFLHSENAFSSLSESSLKLQQAD